MIINRSDHSPDCGYASPDWCCSAICCRYAPYRVWLLLTSDKMAEVLPCLLLLVRVRDNLKGNSKVVAGSRQNFVRRWSMGQEGGD